ncbi:MAG: hypothetical protein ACYCS7_06870 [Acidimicrobiales bacterium]
MRRNGLIVLVPAEAAPARETEAGVPGEPASQVVAPMKSAERGAAAVGVVAAAVAAAAAKCSLLPLRLVDPVECSCHPRPGAQDGLDFRGRL